MLRPPSEPPGKRRPRPRQPPAVIVLVERPAPALRVHGPPPFRIRARRSSGVTRFAGSRCHVHHGSGTGLYRCPISRDGRAARRRVAAGERAAPAGRLFLRHRPAVPTWPDSLRSAVGTTGANQLVHHLSPGRNHVERVVVKDEHARLHSPSSFSASSIRPGAVAPAAVRPFPSCQRRKASRWLVPSESMNRLGGVPVEARTALKACSRTWTNPAGGFGPSLEGTSSPVAVPRSGHRRSRPPSVSRSSAFPRAVRRSALNILSGSPSSPSPPSCGDRRAGCAIGPCRFVGQRSAPLRTLEPRRRVRPRQRPGPGVRLAGRRFPTSTKTTPAEREHYALSRWTARRTSPARSRCPGMRVTLEVPARAREQRDAAHRGLRRWRASNRRTGSGRGPPARGNGP